MAIETFEQLNVWQKAHALTLQVYKQTETFPTDERYGLTSQVRRATVSVPANIAEGFKRRGQRDKAHFYNIAQASLEEARYYFLLARDLGYRVQHAELSQQADEIGRMLHALIRAVRSDGERS